MKDGHYIGLHTQVRFWLPYNRKYTELEALISHTLDINDDKSWSISGYSKLWGWGRTRVRNFLHNLRTANGHHRDTHLDSKRTASRQGIVIKINNFDAKANTQQTSSEQATVQTANREQDTTIKKKNKNKKKPKELPYPENFSTSENVAKWCAKNSYNPDDYLEPFELWANSKYRVYASWDRVFMRFITGDWGKVRTRNNGNGLDPKNPFAGLDKAGEIIKQRIKEEEDAKNRLGQV